MKKYTIDKKIDRTCTMIGFACGCVSGVTQVVVANTINQSPFLFKQRNKFTEGLDLVCKAVTASTLCAGIHYSVTKVAEEITKEWLKNMKPSVDDVEVTDEERRYDPDNFSQTYANEHGYGQMEEPDDGQI